MLYLVATPIGNISDITFRALEVMRLVDYILCEDTRYSQKLLTHYDIKKPLKSFHKFSESLKESQVIEDLLQGKLVALISDAGTPGISDPGEKLVAAAIEQNIPVQSIPGPCAAITALTCSGLSTDRFQFLGFLPKHALSLKKMVAEALNYPGTTIFYESPHRLVKTLQDIQKFSEKCIVVIARELTKKFEEIVRGTPEELLKHWSKNPVKGEIVLLIQGSPPLKEEDWQELSLEKHIEMLETAFLLDKKEAMKLAASQRGLSKRDLYQQLIEKKKP